MTTLLSALPFLLPTAEGTAAAGSSGSMVTTLMTFGLIIAIFYFLIIRPQSKREKETKKMLAAIKKGDKVVTIGGIRGTVLSVKETTVVVKVDDNAKIEFSKAAISSIVEKQGEKPAAASTEKSAPAPEKKRTTKKAQAAAKAAEVAEGPVDEALEADEDGKEKE